MARTISTIEGEGGRGKWEKEKENKADKLIEAEKSETGKVRSDEDLYTHVYSQTCIKRPSKGLLKSGLLIQMVSGLVAKLKGRLHLMHANYCNISIVYHENRTSLKMERR